MRFKLFRSAPGEIGPTSCWVIFHDVHMYCHDYLLGVLWQFLFEYGQDQHLVG